MNFPTFCFPSFRPGMHSGLKLGKTKLGKTHEIRLPYSLALATTYISSFDDRRASLVLPSVDVLGSELLCYIVCVLLSTPTTSPHARSRLLKKPYAYFTLKSILHK